MERLRLLMFGGLTLRTGSEATTGASTRRHRLALLALLAIVRDRGLDRDKILAYFWPESDTEHARHGLNQLLYFQRHHLDDGGLFFGRKTLRLNPAVITTEVWEFEDALAAGDNEAAVQLYAGPFLDGFFLRGAPQFERWADDQRRRLEKRCAQAIMALARAAAVRGDQHQALAWWRRAAEVNPFDSETARHLIESALAVGDRSAAVRHAHDHADLLRTELSLDPDPAVMQMIDQLRGSSR
jgi:DNA-binding SARP family transcriptional activator